MTWNSGNLPANQPTWTFDTSLQSAGSTLLWGIDGAGTWDVASNWANALLSGGTLSYQSTGLQLTSLAYTNQAATALPGAAPACRSIPSRVRRKMWWPAGRPAGFYQLADD